jgi:hypothetical protein
MEAPRETPRPFSGLLTRCSIYILAYKVLLEAHYRSRFKRGITTIDSDYRLKFWRPDTEPPGFRLIIKACDYDMSRITVKFSSNKVDLVVAALEYFLRIYDPATIKVSSYSVEITFNAFGPNENVARRYFGMEPDA